MSVTKSTITITEFHGKKTGAPSYDAPVVLVGQLGRNDVLLGRGTGPNEHPGNICYRALVKEILQGIPPSLVDRKFKLMLAKQVISKIQERGGQFVNRIYGSGQISSSKTGSMAPKPHFALVPDKVAIEKTVQTFRFQLRVVPKTGQPRLVSSQTVNRAVSGTSRVSTSSTSHRQAKVSPTRVASLSEESGSQGEEKYCSSTSKDRIPKSALCRSAFPDPRAYVHETAAPRDDSWVTLSFHKTSPGLLELQKRQEGALDIQPKHRVPKTPQEEAIDVSTRSVAASKWKPSHSSMDPPTSTSAEPALANLLLQGGTPTGGASQDPSALLLLREHLSANAAAEEARRNCSLPLGLLSRPLPTAPLPPAALLWLARGDQQWSPSLEHLGALELLSKLVADIPPPQVDPTMLPGLLAATSHPPYYHQHPYTNSSSSLSAYSGATSLRGVDSTSLLEMILLEQALSTRLE